MLYSLSALISVVRAVIVPKCLDKRTLYGLEEVIDRQG